MPGNEEQQGAVGGGVGGAAAGAAIAEDNRAIGAIIGGVLGAGGGYLIGREVGNRNEDDAREAAEEARANPVSADEARTAATADIDRNGYITLDEVVALEEADLSDDEIIRRLRATNQVFALSNDQERLLLNDGVSRDVVRALRTLNQDVESIEAGRISQPKS